MRRKRSLLAGTGTVRGEKKCSLPFESPEVTLRRWDTWGRSNQPALPSAPHCFFHSYTGWFFFFFLICWKPVNPWWILALTLDLVGLDVRKQFGIKWICFWLRRGGGVRSKGWCWTQSQLNGGSGLFPCLNSHGKISKASHKSQREPGLSLKFLFHYCCFQAFPERLQK